MTMHAHAHTHTHTQARVHTHTHEMLRQEEAKHEEVEDEATIEDVRSDLRVLHRLLIHVCARAGVTPEEIKAANNGTPTPTPGLASQ